jgi:hypothetical protein
MKSGPVRLTLGNPLDPRVLYHVIVTLALGALSLARRPCLAKVVTNPRIGG